MPYQTKASCHFRSGHTHAQDIYREAFSEALVRQSWKYLDTAPEASSQSFSFVL